MSKEFIAKIQKLSVLEKTVLSHLIRSGTKPTTGSGLARKINILNSAKEADAITKKLEKSKIIRQSGTNGHVITKEFRSDAESLEEMAKFNVIVAPIKEKPIKFVDIPQSQPNNPSTTVPTYVTFMENIMFLDKVSAIREDEYQAKLSDLMKELGPKTLKLDSKSTQEMRERSVDALNRKFYAYEMARYEEHKKKTLEQTNLFANSSLPNFSDSDKEKLAQLNIELSNGLKSFMISGNFDSRRIEGLRKEYRHVISEIKQDAVNLQPKGEYGSAAEHKAMVVLFNDKYPTLNRELTKHTLEKSKGMDPECMKAGRILLNIATLAANPSGFLIGKGLNGILGTDAMSGFTKRIGSHVDRAMSTLGVNTESQAWKYVGMAATVAVVGVLSYTLGDVENGIKFIQDMSANAPDIGEAFVPDGIEVEPQAPTAETSPPNAPQAPTAETPPPNVPPAQTSPFPVGEGGVYTVMRGDTLSQIVERQLLDAKIPYNYTLIDSMVDQMVEANNIDNRDEILSGASLALTHIEGVDYSIGNVSDAPKMGAEFDERIKEELELKNDDLIMTDPDYGKGSRGPSRMI
jgi:hypothetical protein